MFIHVCSIPRTGIREVQMNLKAMVHCHSHGHMITGSSVSSDTMHPHIHAVIDRKAIMEKILPLNGRHQDEKTKSETLPVMR